MLMGKAALDAVGPSGHGRWRGRVSGLIEGGHAAAQRRG